MSGFSEWIYPHRPPSKQEMRVDAIRQLTEAEDAADVPPEDRLPSHEMTEQQMYDRAEELREQARNRQQDSENVLRLEDPEW